MNLNNKGFGIIPVLLVILLISVISFGGYYVWNENKAEDSTNTENSSKVDTSSNAEESTEVSAGNEVIHTITFNQTEYSFVSPESWVVNELNTLGDENLVYVVSPEGYQLEIQLLSKSFTENTSVSSHPEGGESFKGFKNNQYYLHPQPYVDESMGTELIFISSCEFMHCYTSGNSRYDFNFSLRRSDFESSISRNQVDLDAISRIMSSIRII